MTRRAILSAAIVSLAVAGGTARADEVLETLDAARAAYEAGDIQDTLEELAYAQSLVREMKTEGLTAFLPDAPDGWNREINTDMGAAMTMFGGGVGAEAEYSDDSESFKVTIMADNPMVQGFAGMLGGVGQLIGKRVRIGSEKFMDADGELTALVDNRVLVQASGASVDVMKPILEQIDFEAMADYGR